MSLWAIWNPRPSASSLPKLEREAAAAYPSQYTAKYVLLPNHGSLHSKRPSSPRFNTNKTLFPILDSLSPGHVGIVSNQSVFSFHHKQKYSPPPPFPVTVNCGTITYTAQASMSADFCPDLHSSTTKSLYCKDNICLSQRKILSVFSMK